VVAPALWNVILYFQSFRFWFVDIYLYNMDLVTGSHRRSEESTINSFFSTSYVLLIKLKSWSLIEIEYIPYKRSFLTAHPLSRISFICTIRPILTIFFLHSCSSFIHGMLRLYFKFYLSLGLYSCIHLVLPSLRPECSFIFYKISSPVLVQYHS
jgi:hypothetical protein